MKLGFIGCGNMANAIMGGVISSGLMTPDEIIGSDPLEETVPPESTASTLQRQTWKSSRRQTPFYSPSNHSITTACSRRSGTRSVRTS